jgi:hypothetical protein
MKASMRILPFLSAASNADSTSPTCLLIGFSQSTCFPASTARIDQSQCSVFGNEMYTASTSASSSSAWYDPYARSISHSRAYPSARR